MDAINNYNVHEGTRVCSKHFKKKNYYKTTNGLDRLIKTAVPDVDVVTNNSWLYSYLLSFMLQHLIQEIFIFPQPGLKNVSQSSESDSSDDEQSLKPEPMETEQFVHELNDTNHETEEVKVATVNVVGSNIKVK